MLSHYLNLLVICFTTHIESCTLKRCLDSAVMPWRYHFTKAEIFSRLSQPCRRKSEASTTGWERITHRGPALHCMGSCEPSGRKQQRITVRKLLLGMKKWRNETERQRRKGRERGINKVIFSHRQSTGPMLRITQYGAITWKRPAKQL